MVAQCVWSLITKCQKDSFGDDAYDDEDDTVEDDAMAEFADEIADEAYDRGFADGMYEQYEGNNPAARVLQEAYNEALERYYPEDAEDDTEKPEIDDCQSENEKAFVGGPDDERSDGVADGGEE